MSNPGVDYSMKAALAVGGLVALPNLGRKADFWDVWSEHGVEVVQERIRTAQAPEQATRKDGGMPAQESPLPMGFTHSKGGLYFTPTDQEGNPLPEVWLGPSLHFLARTRDSQNEEWGLLLEWEDPDGKTHRWAMPYSMLTDSRQGWRAELASGGYIGATGQQARTLLAELFVRIKPKARARCVPGTGWHYGRFVLPDAVYGSGSEMLVLQAAKAMNPFSLSGELDSWKESIGAWCVGNSRLMVAVGLALAGPLLALVGMDSSGVHIYGKSSTGKTTVVRVAWSVWGGPDGMRSWRSTSNALEATASIHNDCVLALDEIGQAPGRVVGEAAYLLLNGLGKARANQDGSARKVKSWALMVLSNGEMTLEDKLHEDGQRTRAGQEVRLVDLPADAGQGMGAWENLHGHATPGQFSDAIKGRCAELHGHLGRAWVEFLSQHQEEAKGLRAAIQKTADAWSAGAESGQVMRVAARFALIGLAGELAVKSGLLPWPEGASLAAAKRCLDAWQNARGGTGDQEDIEAQEIIRGYIARYGASRFENIDPGYGERVIERAGFRRTFLGQDQFIFTSEQWKEIFKGRNPTQAARALAKAGVLVCNDGRNLQQKISLPDLGRVRAYVVRINMDTGTDSDEDGQCWTLTTY